MRVYSVLFDGVVIKAVYGYNSITPHIIDREIIEVSLIDNDNKYKMAALKRWGFAHNDKSGDKSNYIIDIDFEGVILDNGKLGGGGHLYDYIYAKIIGYLRGTLITKLIE